MMKMRLKDFTAMVKDAFRQWRRHNALQRASSLAFFTALVSVAFTIAGASGAFGVLQDSLNTLWNVAPAKPRSIKAKIQSKIFPFLFVSGLGILIILWSAIIPILFNAASF